MRSSILIIYTGGTIGMKTDAATGALVPFDFSGIYDEFPSLKRLNVDIDVHTVSPVIDSSNVEPANWVALARLIRDNYARYDGFVVLHGTDTMSYTASALSFMLENLAKPVVFTGSQIPIGVLRTDGRENLITAIEIAGARIGDRPEVPEVSLYFQNRLFRANRTTKRSAEALSAFRSYNYPPLAEVGVNIAYNLPAILQPEESPAELRIATKLSGGIELIKLFPGMGEEILRAMFSAPGLRAVVLETFGAGNAPDTAARIIGDYLQRKHNITLLITSKPGGSGIPATLETVRARPDGYTISLTSANVLTVVPQYKKCGFTYKDLAPVAQVNVFTMGWGVRADSGIASVQDLMDKAKAERGKYSLASPGAFTAQRFYHANVMKLFPESDLPYVAYNGGAEIVTALLGNHISAGFTPVVNFKPHKDIRVIAVCGAQRDPNYPDAPTFKEMFGDGFVFDSVYGIVAPLKTPKDRIERLQSLIKEALSDPDVQAKFAKVNMTTNYLPADEFGKVIEGYYKLFEEPIRKAKEAEKK